MKIGIESKACEYFGDDGYKKLADIGFSAIDFNLASSNNIIHTASAEEVKEYLLRQKRLADEAGIEISQVHGPWRFPTRDTTEEDRAERMGKMKKTITATVDLGCKYWVIHPIMPFTHNTPTDKVDETIKMNFDFMRELLTFAKEQGVVICFENMPFKGLPLSRPKEILNFVREMNDDNFKICLDTGHVAVYEELNLADEVRRLGKEIKTLHVHDNDGKNDRHMAPYFGVIDWEDFGKALEEIKFDGVFSLETAPSTKLPPDIFEEMCRSYYKISKNIIG